MRSNQVALYSGVLDEAAAKLLNLYTGLARVAFDAREFELDTVPTALLHIVIVVDTSPSIEAFVQTICDAVGNVIDGLKDEEVTNILITIRGLHENVPWVSAAPISELTTPALRPYKLFSGTPLFRAVIEVCAYAREVDQEMRQEGVQFMHTRVTVLTDADDNMSRPLTARIVCGAVKALKATGNFTFTGIGVGCKKRLFTRVFRAMGFDNQDISTVADSEEILAEFTTVVTEAIEMVGILALAA